MSDDFYPDDWSPKLGQKEIEPTKSWQKKTRVVNKSSGDKYDILICRGTLWGNPFTHIKDRATKAEFVVGTRRESIEKYKEYFFKRIDSDPDFKRKTHLLKGITMACYCVPLDCHGHVIRDYLLSLGEED